MSAAWIRKYTIYVSCISANPSLRMRLNTRRRGSARKNEENEQCGREKSCARASLLRSVLFVLFSHFCSPRTVRLWSRSRFGCFSNVHINLINVDWARLVIHNLAKIIMLCIITINNALSIRYVDDEKSLAYLHSAVQYRYRMPAVAVSEHFNIAMKHPSPSSSPDLSTFSVFRLRLN